MSMVMFCEYEISGGVTIEIMSRYIILRQTTLYMTTMPY